MKFVKCLILSIFLVSYTIHAQEIKVNQVGYYAQEVKSAVIPFTNSTEFTLKSAEGVQVVYTGSLSAADYWEPSEENVKIADFSDFTNTGEYYISVEGLGDSYNFFIEDHVHDETFGSVMKAYYFNRASTAIPQQYGGIHARALGHPDDVVYIHRSAESDERPTGSTISAPKGWYDAGDYGKYIVNSGISTYTILAIYEHYPEFSKRVDFNIPESGDDVPDVLDEAKWNLDWMLDMQDPNDGGVYHKLTTLNFTGEDMPSEATADRYVVMKGTAATLDFAAVMAQASRIFEEYETQFPGYAERCLLAADAAWEWAQANSNVTYRQPTDVRTGSYGDRNFDDEFAWAGAELYITTKDEAYLTEGSVLSIDMRTPDWPNVHGLTWISLAHHIDDLTEAVNPQTVRNRVLGLADDILDDYNNSAYKTSINNFYWGSNALVGNQSLVLTQAFELTKDSAYHEAALSNLDYLLGKNATGYSFVTGVGDKSPMNIHHRQSQSDGIDAPVPGFLAGGPNPGQQDDCVYPSSLPALSYSDTWCSYASNEVTINWNAPLAFMLASSEIYSRSEEDVISAINVLNKKSDIQVYPTLSNFGFKIDNTENASYEILDLQGRSLEKATVINGAQVGNNLDNGTYIIRIKQGNFTEAVKVVKQ